MGLVHSEVQVLYARYLKSGMTLEQFCKFHQVPYWDFSDWINQWEKLHGAKYVEDSTKRCYKQGRKLFSSDNPSYGSNAQKLFPMEFVENNSPIRFPSDNPSFNVNLELPKPGTIIKGAKLTFPSGIVLNIPRITIKALVLMAIMYEGNSVGIE